MASSGNERCQISLARLDVRLCARRLSPRMAGPATRRGLFTRRARGHHAISRMLAAEQVGSRTNAALRSRTMMQVLSTRRARIRGCFRILAIASLRRHDSALIGANQLVGAEQHHVRPGLDGFADGRFVRQPELLQVQQRARSEIRQSSAGPCCAPVRRVRRAALRW